MNKVEKKWKELKRKEEHSSQGWKPGRAALAKVRAQNERLNIRVYLNPELRKVWFPSLGYVGNFILKSSCKTLQTQLCPCDGSGHLCLFLYPGVRLWSSLWGLTIMRYGAIQTRGNFPLPFNAPWCRSNKGQLSVAMQCPPSKGQFSFGSEVVHLKSRFRARWAAVVCKNSLENFLMKLTNFL
mgnify:CR=1 FL=1